jgi:hypothetical protein
MIEKTPEITATVSWKTGTDYDIYAVVYTLAVVPVVYSAQSIGTGYSIDKRCP